MTQTASFTERFPKDRAARAVWDSIATLYRGSKKHWGQLGSLQIQRDLAELLIPWAAS